MTISHELNQQVLVLSLSGDLDHHAAHDAITYIAQQVSMNRSKTVEINFSGITFMDSSGLAVVLNAKRLAERCGSKLIIRSVPQNAMKIFRAARLEQLITIE